MSLNVVNIDPEAMYKKLVKDLETRLETVVNPGDERRIVAEEIFSVIVAIANLANAYGDSQLLRYSGGEMLDNLCDFVGVTRLPAEKATVSLQFTLSAPAGATVTIPAGTRVTPDGILFFATTETISDNAGSPTVDVTALATDVGTAANGCSVGLIKTIVDPVLYVASVTNTTVSAGGSDVEDDDSLRTRAMLAPRAFSVAGPAGAYEYWALTANSEIADVKATSPSACEVVITVLMEGGELPTQTVLDEVAAVVSADTVRPLTDHVTVQAPETIDYTVTATYYLSSDNSTDSDAKKAAVQEAYQDYLAWQCAVLGRAINPDELRRRLLTAGAMRVDLTSPSYTTVLATKVAKSSSSSALIYGGVL